jgi:2-polyprenyl-3-methyl-5-hydroxy-6-metoxy-1,4-benzoquinol methylase
LGIIAAEYILRVVPTGTHTWKKFIRPTDLITLFEKSKERRFLLGYIYQEFCFR